MLCASPEGEACMAVGASGPKQKDVILMTGATGALGSEMLPLMLRKGYDVVCLVRASDTAAAQKRIDAIAGSGHPNLRVVRGDITKSQCGIADADLRQLHEWRVTRIFHCAASINFQDRDAAYSTNVNGVKNVIGLADTLGVRNIIHVSTAYVAGEAKLLRETDLPEPANFCPRNVYEATKQTGEALIRAWARQKDRRYSIIRPSIIVGRKDGSAPSFYGFYRFFMPVDGIAVSVRSRNDLPPDIRVGTDGWVDTQLAILMADLGINYIPLDWCAAMTAELLDKPICNAIYHLVHHNPLQMRAGLRWALERLKLRTQIVGTPREKTAIIATQSAFLRRKQRQIDVIHNLYLPYCTASPCFEMNTTPQILNGKFRCAPDIDKTFIHRMIDFGKSHNWGLQLSKRSPS